MWCLAKHISIRCPGIGSYSLCFLFLSIPYLEHLAPWPNHDLCSKKTLRKYPEGHDLLWTYSWCVSHMYCYFTVASLLVSLSALLCPSLWLYIYLLSDWSSLMERPKDVSWAWTESNISGTSKPQASYTPWGDSSRGAVLLATIVIPSSSLWFFYLNLSPRSFTDQEDKTAARSGWELVSCTHGQFLLCSSCMLFCLNAKMR